MKRALSLILVLLMVAALFAGCTKGGGNEATATPAANTGSTNTGSSTGSTDTGSTATDEPETTTDPKEVVLPLTDTLKTYTIFATFDTSASTIQTYAENMYFQEMAKRTNVTWEWIHPPGTSAAEQFQIMIAGQMYDDVVRGFSTYYTRGIDDAIAQDIIHPLNDYTQYLPNLMGYVEADSDKKMQMLSDNGYYWGIPCMLSEEQGSWGGSVVRTDLLEKYGLSMPETFDDWEVMLTTWLENEPAMANGPLALTQSGFSFVMAFLAGYNVTGIASSRGAFMNKEGVATYSPLEPGFKEYIVMMNDWYKKGLVQQDFYAHGNFFTARDDMAKGEVGSAECTYDLTTYTNVFTDPTWTVAAAPYPVKNRGDIPHVRQSQDIMRMNFTEVLTTAVSEEDIPIILRYYDYMFTDEGSLLANWGIEGLTFEYDENGNPQYTDLIRNNPEGLTFLGANAAYLGSRNEAGIYEWTRELDETTLECMEAWNIADNDWMFPDAATMTQEENTTFASIMSDIDTLLSENCIAFIIGSRPISELDGFLNQIKGMGLDQATAIKQASLDRYFARLG